MRTVKIPVQDSLSLHNNQELSLLIQSGWQPSMSHVIEDGDQTFLVISLFKPPTSVDEIMAPWLKAGIILIIAQTLINIFLLWR